MIRQNKSGFTLVELLAVIIVLAIILAIAVPSISNVINSSRKSAFGSNAKLVLKAIEFKKLEDESFDPLTITQENIQDELKIDKNNYAQVTFSQVGNNIRVILVGAGKFEGLTAYGTFKNMNVVNSEDYDVTPPVITLNGASPMTIERWSTYNEPGATALDNKDGDLTTNIVITGSVDTSLIGEYTITYSVSDQMGNSDTVTRTVNVILPYNPPVLATGMTPIKWGGSAWVTTTEDDPDWHRYSTTDKKWANARTADGSMWVWIPRYVYKITSGWHSNTTGTIDIKFSYGTDDTRGGTLTLDTGTTSNASNNKWTNHPAFKFGTTELTGFWMAKFEPSGSASNLSIVPGVASFRTISPGEQFNAARNMETNSKYGWGTSGNGIDTHMAKNTEWGAVAYLAQSTYGKNAPIWINPANNYATGCAGDSATSSTTTGCLRAYNTPNGQQASTTGNIYGIYDMVGGAWEVIAAYLNNGHSNLNSYGSSIVNADAKYKDVYTKGASDNEDSNYALTANKKGDAIWEISLTSVWYNSYSHMARTDSPFLDRGGGYSDGVYAGIFAYYYYHGSGNTRSFRPILLVGAGL